MVLSIPHLIANLLLPSYLMTALTEWGAEILLNTITEATKTMMPCRSNQPHSQAKWWNEKCDNTINNLKNSPNRLQVCAHFCVTIHLSKHEREMDILSNTT